MFGSVHRPRSHRGGAAERTDFLITASARQATSAGPCRTPASGTHLDARTRPRPADRPASAADHRKDLRESVAHNGLGRTDGNPGSPRLASAVSGPAPTGDVRTPLLADRTDLAPAAIRNSLVPRMQHDSCRRSGGTTGAPSYHARRSPASRQRCRRPSAGSTRRPTWPGSSAIAGGGEDVQSLARRQTGSRSSAPAHASIGETMDTRGHLPRRPRADHRSDAAAPAREPGLGGPAGAVGRAQAVGLVSSRTRSL
jgi:hypothetical protein